MLQSTPWSRALSAARPQWGSSSSSTSTALDHADNEGCIAWARETSGRMQPFFAPARYVNYLGDDETDDALAVAYGPNYRRLQKIKAHYDPTNFFHMNQNIAPQH
jgi:FAD/FMN-containing dehydrogenase